jgi:hypothetical protein
MALNIFVCYRQADSAYAARSVRDWLKWKMGEEIAAFLDTDGLDGGDLWKEVLDEQVRKCQVLLAIIGPKWIDITDELGNRRLDTPRDFVQTEIEIALSRKIPIIPVLIDETPWPKQKDLPGTIVKLIEFHHIKIHSRSFDTDAENLLRAVRKRLPKPSPPEPWIERLHRKLLWGKSRVTEGRSEGPERKGLRRYVIVGVLLLIALTVAISMRGSGRGLTDQEFCAQLEGKDRQACLDYCARLKGKAHDECMGKNY